MSAPVSRFSGGKLTENMSASPKTFLVDFWWISGEFLVDFWQISGDFSSISGGKKFEKHVFECLHTPRISPGTNAIKIFVPAFFV